MDQWYVQMYYIPLFILCAASIVQRNKDYIFITCLMVCAFFATRLTTYIPQDSRTMVDFSNNLIVCACLLLHQRQTPLKVKRIIPFLVLTYTALIASQAIHLLGLLTYTERRYVAEALSFVQLLSVLGGLTHGGHRLGKHTKRMFNRVYDSYFVFRGKINAVYKTRMDSAECLRRNHKNMAKDS